MYLQWNMRRFQNINLALHGSTFDAIPNKAIYQIILVKASSPHWSIKLHWRISTQAEWLPFIGFQMPSIIQLCPLHLH